MPMTIGLIFDICMCGICLASALTGMRKGLFLTVISLFRWVLCIFLAYLGTPYIKALLLQSTALKANLASHLSVGIHSLFGEHAYSFLSDLAPAPASQTTSSSGAAPVPLEEDAATRLADSVSDMLISICAFLLLFVVLLLVSRILIHAMSAGHQRESLVSKADGLLGLLFGVGRGLVFVCLLLLIIFPLLSLIGPDLSAPALEGLQQSHVAGMLYFNNPIISLLAQR